MRFIIYGAGAVGGVIGARLFEHGYEVALVARGEHGEAIARQGLRLEHPGGVAVLPIPVAGHPGRLGTGPGDVILLTMKTQDTHLALRDLADAAGTELPVFCMQNGVENERAALRLFPRVYGASVALPAAHLVPGTVQAYAAPITGILDVGRHPRGVDDLAQQVAAALAASTFSSRARQDLLRWKYRKLLTNLGNAVEAVCGPAARGGPVTQRAQQEGVACLRAAGIAFASEGEDTARRAGLLQLHPVGGAERPGGSTWQSLHRGVGTIETDYLNGEIVLLGRLRGVPTPVNDLLQRLARQMASQQTPPGSVSTEQFLSRLDHVP